ncbi:MAG: copper resistance protein CopC [Burkholderiaceae bacterium]
MRRYLLVALLTTTLLAAHVDHARAHSKRMATVPADGAVLQAAPDTIEMTFSRPVRLTLIRLTDADGKRYEVSRPDGTAAVKRFEGKPVPLGPGAYVVKWRGLSDDGHPLDGEFRFRIGP